MNQNTQTTTSLALAAYLETLGIACVSVTPTEVRSQLTFHFNISEEDFSSHSDFFLVEKDKHRWAYLLRSIKSIKKSYLSIQKLRKDL